VRKMNQPFLSRTAFATLILCLLTGFVVFSSAGASDEVGATGSEPCLTPAPGKPVRKAVLDALRQELKRLHGLKVVFEVRQLKVKDGWAWAHTQPQSPDGADKYEDVSALLNIRDGVWKVAEIPCAEVDNPECLDGPEYFVGLKKRFPGVPTEILPVWPERGKD
jgi:hypothetical protein